jgi:dynein heavy chain
LPPRTSPADLKAGLARQSGGPAAPLAVFLRQEVARLDGLLGRVASDLAGLRAALAGTAILTPALAAALEALAAGRPPAVWTKASWEAPSLAAWADGAAARAAQLARWLAGGRPKAVWLPGLFNPPGFFTAVKQEAARAKAAEGWALDDVSLVLTVTHPPVGGGESSEGSGGSGPGGGGGGGGGLPGMGTGGGGSGGSGGGGGGGLVLSGLWLDGAAWDGKAGRLADPADPRKGGGAPVALPWVHMAAVCQAAGGGGGSGGGAVAPRPGTYGAPLYRARRREGKAMAEVSLRTDGEPVAWTLRGVAVLCNPE